MGVRSETSTTEDADARFENAIAWQSGAAAGFVATAVMGLAITATDLSTLRLAIAGLYGFEGSILAGWAAHLVHGTLFGVVFAVILSDPGLFQLTEWAWKTVLAGVVYGLVLAIVGAGFVMPIWLSIVGIDVGAPVSTFDASVIAWHVVYGLVLGGVYAAIERRDVSASDAVSSPV